MCAFLWAFFGFLLRSDSQILVRGVKSRRYSHLTRLLGLFLTGPIGAETLEPRGTVGFLGITIDGFFFGVVFGPFGIVGLCGATEGFLFLGTPAGVLLGVVNTGPCFTFLGMITPYRFLLDRIRQHLRLLSVLKVHRI